MSPDYPDVEDVIGFHAEAIGCSDETAANRLLRPEVLESALMRCQWYAALQGADIVLQAAVLAHGIAEAQAFIEGNKRTAHVALRTFLLEHGLRTTASEADFFHWTFLYSTGSPPEDVAPLIRATLVPNLPE